MRVLLSVLITAVSVVGIGLVIRTAPEDASAAGKGEFLADCPFSGRVAADPIVFPGKRRAGHLHDFLGARGVNGRTTNAALRRSARNTCAPRSDRSAYWVPTLYEAGRPVKPEQVTIYYTVKPALAKELRPYPRNLRIVAGNARETGRVAGAPNTWSCLGGGPSGPAVVQCPKGSRLELILNFPDCWDGRRSDSRGHQSHMAYSLAATCPRKHPVAVPQVQFKVRWPTEGGQKVTISSGNGYSAHGDFMNAWNADALQKRIDACLKPLVKCGANGRPLSLEPGCVTLTGARYPPGNIRRSPNVYSTQTAARSFQKRLAIGWHALPPHDRKFLKTPRGLSGHCA